MLKTQDIALNHKETTSSQGPARKLSLMREHSMIQSMADTKNINTYGIAFEETQGKGKMYTGLNLVMLSQLPSEQHLQDPRQIEAGGLMCQCRQELQDPKCQSSSPTGNHRRSSLQQACARTVQTLLQRHWQILFQLFSSQGRQLQQAACLLS